MVLFHISMGSQTMTEHTLLGMHTHTCIHTHTNVLITLAYIYWAGHQTRNQRSSNEVGI